MIGSDVGVHVGLFVATSYLKCETVTPELPLARALQLPSASLVASSPVHEELL